MERLQDQLLFQIPDFDTAVQRGAEEVLRGKKEKKRGHVHMKYTQSTSHCSAVRVSQVAAHLAAGRGQEPGDGADVPHKLQRVLVRLNVVRVNVLVVRARDDVFFCNCQGPDGTGLGLQAGNGRKVLAGPDADALSACSVQAAAAPQAHGAHPVALVLDRRRDGQRGRVERL